MRIISIICASSAFTNGFITSNLNPSTLVLRHEECKLSPYLPCQREHLQTVVGLASSSSLTSSKADDQYFSSTSTYTGPAQYVAPTADISPSGQSAPQKVTLTRFFQQVVEEQPEVSLKLESYPLEL